MVSSLYEVLSRLF